MGRQVCQDSVIGQAGERLFTVQQVAAFLQVHPCTVRRAIESGRLACVRPETRVIRITSSALREYIHQASRPTKSVHSILM